MPEKTRDRKNWFPRFKSNWLGMFRSKQMFHCCECAVKDLDGAKYKGSEGKHCACGKDQWHMAKSVEEAEYNRRMEISKALGGMRYDDAVEHLRRIGASEYNYRRFRCSSDDSCASTVSMTCDDHGNEAYHDHQTAGHYIKEETVEFPAEPVREGMFTRELKLSLGTTLRSGYDQLGPDVGAPHGSPTYAGHQTYTPLGVDMLETSAPYEHFVPSHLADEETFSDLLHDIWDEESRGCQQPTAYQYASKPAVAPSMGMRSQFSFPPLSTQTRRFDGADLEPEYFAYEREEAAYAGRPYHHPGFGTHTPQFMAPVISASFPSAM
ncbi:hypothetical protein P43SY_004123 [Pythium insidiosum]|uniref:Uncharacterized protein n=1 Tax=Pythium insidiosum TaxID=114742 RepID=A0AAD5Q5S6_PYTIN|nr:hypothetical protein P43SY_004123 [Pythium insidiosum]